MHIGSILHTSPERVRRAHELTAHTRLRIPLLVGEDCIHGHSFWEGATIFPTQLGMAASWDADLLERVARATAVEVAATGVHWTFSPVLCIARDLRWGRVGETFGEDPFLIGELAAAMVRSYQGDGLTDPTAILATAKHFAGYSETQGGRDASEADISRRKLRSWFLPPFERVARAGCRTFMLGYQTTDGVPITINGWLLDEVLRGEWGYTGRGLLVESDLDGAVGRILRVKFELGLFEDPRRPDPRELKAYRQVDLAPGETRRVSIEISAADLSIVDAAGRRIVEPGEFELRIGRSSRRHDQLTATFTVG